MLTMQEKNDKLKALAQEIETNRVRLENAEQTTQIYLEHARNLNEKLLVLSLEEING